MFRKQDTRIHFVGVGGMGMCGIAEVLINLGYKVSGSDLRETEITKHLAQLGGDIKYGHRADNVQSADVVVVSSAVRGYNLETRSRSRAPAASRSSPAPRCPASRCA